MQHLGSFAEVQLPADDLDAMIAFYQRLGYQLTSRQPWGMARLRAASGATLTLYLRQFWPEPALAFDSPDLPALKQELAELGLPLEEDSVHLEPPRLSFRDPSGNLIYAYQQPSSGPT
jgi:catechol 2,3-dioxygenase-like lactoylglutathione lyase family enzyme